MTTSHNEILQENTIDRFNIHKPHGDSTTIDLHSSETPGDLEAAKTDASDINTKCIVVEQSNEAKHSTSLPVAMAQELTLDLFSPNHSASSGKRHTSTTSLNADRSLASQSIRTERGLIFPPDQRVPVTQPKFPFTGVGRMESRWKGADGVLYTGDDFVTYSSGAMVSKFHFLTAGHCIHRKQFGGWADRVEVQLGGKAALKTKLRSYEGWTGNQDVKYDLGLVTLDRNIGNETGWFGYGYNNAIRAGTLFNSTGYPSDKVDPNSDGVRDDYRVWTQRGKITQTTDLTLRTRDLDIAFGSSGGPLWRKTKSGATIYGVTSNIKGSLYGEFTRITRARFGDIRRWIRQDTAQRPLQTVSSGSASPNHVTAVSTRVAVGQFEDDVLTGGKKVGHFLTDRSLTQVAAQSVHNTAQTMRGIVEADYLRPTIAPSVAPDTAIYKGNDLLTIVKDTSSVIAAQGFIAG